MLKDKLKYLRERKGINQKEIADYLNLTIAAYSHYEKGRREPSIDIIRKICKFYNISADDLLEIEQDD